MITQWDVDPTDSCLNIITYHMSGKPCGTELLRPYGGGGHSWSPNFWEEVPLDPWNSILKELFSPDVSCPCPFGQLGWVVFCDRRNEEKWTPGPSLCPFSMLALRLMNGPSSRIVEPRSLAKARVKLAGASQYFGKIWQTTISKKHGSEVFSKVLACHTSLCKSFRSILNERTLHFQDGESNRRHFQVFLDDGEMSWSWGCVSWFPYVGLVVHIHVIHCNST